MAFRFAARSDIGLGRYTNNQDSGYAGPHLLAVCDGMGGHAAGDVASSVALGRLVALDGESHGGDALAQLERALHEANAELRERAASDPGLQGMGTTATAVVLHGQRISMAHIGDSRCYRWRDGELTRLTHDHTFVQSLVDEGRITEEEADRHPQRSVITRVLSGHPDDDADLSVRETRPGDRYVVCSDGLTGVVRDQTLAELLGEHDDPAACAEALVSLALRGGGADNITCVVAHVVDSSDAPPSSMPETVGSAAVRAAASTAEPQSPAAKAAALSRPQPAEDVDDEPVVGPPASRRRWTLRALAALVVAGVIGAGGYAAYAWSQQQYYVGADGQNVAIYRGLPQDIGPVRMSHVYERQDVALDQLPEYSAEQVRGGITVADLGAARDKVSELRTQVCAQTSPTPTVTRTATPTVTATPTAAATRTATPAATTPTATTSAPTPNPSTSPTPDPSTSTGTTPSDCGQVG
jgi:protein phosphatase